MITNKKMNLNFQGLTIIINLNLSNRSYHNHSKSNISTNLLTV